MKCFVVCTAGIAVLTLLGQTEIFYRRSLQACVLVLLTYEKPATQTQWLFSSTPHVSCSIHRFSSENLVLSAVLLRRNIAAQP